MGELTNGAFSGHIVRQWTEERAFGQGRASGVKMASETLSSTPVRSQYATSRKDAAYQLDSEERRTLISFTTRLRYNKK